jgi:hypothetical protein
MWRSLAERQAERWQELKSCGGCLPSPTGTFAKPDPFFCLIEFSLCSL